MTTDHKKARERFQLQRFFEASGFPASILSNDEEAPNFVIGYEGRRIGVEVTEIFVAHEGPNLPQTQDSIASRIVARARTKYLTAGAPHAHVSVHFAPGRDLGSLNMHATASTLASFVKGLNLSVGQYLQWSSYALPNGPLPCEIVALNMLGVERAEMGHWYAPRAGWVVPLAIEALQARVDGKAAKLASYKAKISENWLLIVSEGNKPSQFFSVESGFNRSAVVSPFTRTFYGRMEGVVIELGV